MPTPVDTGPARAVVAGAVQAEKELGTRGRLEAILDEKHRRNIIHHLSALARRIEDETTRLTAALERGDAFDTGGAMACLQETLTTHQGLSRELASLKVSTSLALRAPLAPRVPFRLSVDTLTRLEMLAAAQGLTSLDASLAVAVAHHWRSVFGHEQQP